VGGLVVVGLGALLELFGQSGLLEHSIGRVPGFNGIINDEFEGGNRAVPYSMVTFSLSFKRTAGFAQLFFELSCIIGHQSAIP